jgi:hypothetical protein
VIDASNIKKVSHVLIDVLRNILGFSLTAFVKLSMSEKENRA